MNFYGLKYSVNSQHEKEYYSEYKLASQRGLSQPTELTLKTRIAKKQLEI